MKPASRLLLVFAALLAAFLGWRLVRPMNIFVVDDRFAWPIDTTQAPEVLGDLRANGCASCHEEFFAEWRTSIHSQAWTDPYFQVDWQFDDAQHICRLCHTPLDRQLPQRIVDYRDRNKWQPVLVDNPDFDPVLQHEGVTCAACHYRDGKIIGVLGTTGAPHPVEQIQDPDQVCIRCHVVEGDRWDTFYRFPPCGTVAEIERTQADGDETHAGLPGQSGEVMRKSPRSLGCVTCHMPVKVRPLVDGGQVYATRRHLWRGGHDPEMVKRALTVQFAEQPGEEHRRVFRLTVMNTGAAHYVPTGTPDRHLTLHLRLLDTAGNIISQETATARRLVLWRPFIIDLSDTRLPRWQPRHHELEVPAGSPAVAVEAEVRYHLLAERRRKRIGYENSTPIDYPVFRQQIQLQPDMHPGGTIPGTGDPF